MRVAEKKDGYRDGDDDRLSTYSNQQAARTLSSGNTISSNTHCHTPGGSGCVQCAGDSSSSSRSDSSA